MGTLSLLILVLIALIAMLVVLKNKQKNDASHKDIFYRRYLESRRMFTHLYKKIPCISFVDNVDPEKIMAYLQEQYASSIIDIFQYQDYVRAKNEQVADITIFAFKEEWLIEVSSNYVEILYLRSRQTTIDDLVKSLATFKCEVVEDTYEMNIIVNNNGGLDLKTLEITPTKLDIEKFYNDDFLAVHETILNRLNTNNDKGIVLLHGLPGTGKTTYLRHLIGAVKKKVLFLSPAVAENLMSPSFIDLLIDNPNAVLIIEDAENIIMDRKVNSSSSVSNLLNLSDGLLSDCLNVQIICTFNSQLSAIDNALMRKGRLIAQYGFGKLNIGKAQALAAHLNIETTVEQPMTLAELTNVHTQEVKVETQSPIGFRTHAMAIEI